MISFKTAMKINQHRKVHKELKSFIQQVKINRFLNKEITKLLKELDRKIKNLIKILMMLNLDR